MTTPMPADQAAKPQIKFCKDCAHFNSPACSVAVKRYSFHDPVTGELDCHQGWWRAASMRKNDGLCGESAKWFEHKPPSLFKRLIARINP